MLAQREQSLFSVRSLLWWLRRIKKWRDENQTDADGGGERKREERERATERRREREREKREREKERRRERKREEGKRERKRTQRWSPERMNQKILLLNNRSKS